LKDGFIGGGEPSVSVAASLRAFLDGNIDYAGLFPPAKLPLETCVRNYVRYRDEPEAWMLGRFICPASRLKELLGVSDSLLAPGLQFPLSVLGRGGRDTSEFIAGFSLDVADIVAFHEAVRTSGYKQPVHVNVYEVKAPPDGLPAQQNDPADPAMRCAATLASCKVSFFFLESGAALEHLPEALETLDRDLRAAVRGSAPGHVGLKLRCGGTEAGSIPSPELLAAILARRRITFKCTAGLHHPFRHWDSTLGAKMHGFINVFAAGMLAEAHALSQEQIRAVLEDDDPANFSFRDDAFQWRNLAIATEQIVKLRQTRMTSFGSCSFDEPREDLKRLGWI
jgi:hypothetical protein